ncbi:MAG TPA: hypothetical protein QGH16_02055 [Verrucomicrobiota bacterium]|nr:hypothetical protein [Verrucomicrobiota bacterium]
MFLSPIVSHPLDTESNQHLGSLCRPALFCVKWNNTPRDELILIKITSV